MRQASRRQNSMRRESADTPLLQKLEIFSDQGISARRSLAHICAKDLGARFPTAEIPQRRNGSRDLRTAEIRHVDIWTVYGPKIYVLNFRGPKIAAPGLGGGGLNFSFRPKFRG